MVQISVIIPVNNGGDDFHTCLKALSTSTCKPDEIIVVDDGSTDSTACLAHQFEVKVLSLEGTRQGPAVARNRGATLAQGDTLVFIDADVAVHPGTLALIKKILDENPDVSALFGSYDDSPPKRGLVSRYKNLQHYFVHQNGRREASTFWAGCGAVRRDVFLEMGGFNENYSRPSIEDIEFGLRLKRAGHKIWLCPEVLTTHLKEWKLSNLLRSDILDRAKPWTQLILSTSYLPSELNLNTRSRLSVLMVWIFLASLAAGFVYHLAWIGSLASVAALVILNLNFYRLIMKKEGLLYCSGSVILHSFYYLYSSITFGVLSVWFLVQKSSGKPVAYL